MGELRIPNEYMHPPLMAVGDSLYNGVRSLSITNGYCQLSAPALVAQALGIRHRFFCPDLPRHVLINLPDWLRQFPDVEGIRRGFAENARFWIACPASPSGRPYFENVAIASTLIADLFTDTWRKADARIAQMRAEHGEKLATLDGPIGDLFMALNTRYVLNPLNHEDLKDATQLDLVEARRPERLLVSIGSNNGLWEICFEARSQRRLNLDGLNELAERLARIAAAGTHIYFNNLPPPSTVPNLMPIPDYAEYEPVGPGNYFETYENRFGFGYGTITAAALKQLDEHVADVNQTIEETLRRKFADQRRLHIVDMWALMRRYDAKHQADTDENTVRTSDRKRFSNVMLEADFWGAFRCGGLMSLDGMHPSGIGYGLMAQKVVEAIRANEEDTLAAHVADVDIEDCYAKDKLLHDMPGIWSLALWLWRDIRRARERGEPDPVKAGRKEEVATDEIMGAATQFKHSERPSR